MRSDRDRARAKAMFDQMSSREKRAHILGYYWPYMAAAVALLVVCVVFVMDMQDNARTKECVYVGIQQEYYEQLQPLVQQLADEAQWPEGLNFLAYPSASSADGMGSLQMMMYLSADELDVAVCDQWTTDLMAKDETMLCAAWPLEDTALGQGFVSDEPLFLVAFGGTARGEKAEQFRNLLAGSAPLRSN